MRRLFALSAFAAVTLTACGGLLSRSPEELRAGQAESIRVCIAIEPQEAAERVRAGWRGCQFIGPMASTNQATTVPGGGVVMIPSGPYAGDWIEVTPSGKGFIVAKGGNGKLGRTVQFLADVQPTEQCKAEVVARGAGPIFSVRAKEVAYYLDHPDRGCPR